MGRSLTVEKRLNKWNTLGLLLPGILLTLNDLRAQSTVIVDSSSPHFRTAIAGAEYGRSRFHQWIWGKDYRQEWTTPVTYPILNLDSAYGGLTPVKEGGGRQTKTLHMVDASGRRWVLRSVNKTYLGALPEIVQGTFVEDVMNDQIATNHPFAALTVPTMAEAAGVYHTNPKYWIVPYSARLGEYNEIFANTLCMLEERPDETQTRRMTAGEAEDIVSSEKMMEKILEENDHLMDQGSYVKTRLFDMFVGDWGRHKDNWRWARFDSGDFKIYRPVPKDRDQTWAKFEGVMLGIVSKMGSFKELQTFDDDIRSISWYNVPAFPLDKRFTNALSLQAWIDTAKSLQRALTDAVIETAIRQMPAQIFAIRGEETIRKLKSRRNNLVRYAQDYYQFLSKDVEIPGTKDKELFDVKRLNDDETDVTVMRISKKGKRDTVYHRVFFTNETNEIRLYGISGGDIFEVSGLVKKGIKVRLIGGTDKDSITDRSLVGGWGHKTKIYDNPGNDISTSAESKVHLSRYPSINAYDYETFKYDSRGIRPIYYFNTFYRFYVGLGYTVTKNKTRDGQFSSRHSVGVNYSLVENSFSPYYNGTLTNLVGRWNANFTAGYDQVRRFNYFGAGNESKFVGDAIEFYYMRQRVAYASAGLEQSFKDRHTVRLDFLYNMTEVYDNDNRYTSRKLGQIDPADYDWKYFFGPQLSYSYVRTNDPVLATRGYHFEASASYIKNLKESRAVTNLSGFLNFYVPLFKAFSLAIKSGGATLWGEPEFYQLNNIGGFYTLRGIWRYRFWGESIAYNQNELRWLPEVRGHLFSGRAGLLAFYDQGRVWQPGESSNKWHSSYGAGVMLVPFNKISFTVTYGISEETKRMNIRLGRLL